MTNHDIKEDVHEGKRVALDLRRAVEHLGARFAAPNFVDQLSFYEIQSLSKYITHLEAQIATAVEAEREGCAETVEQKMIFVKGAYDPVEMARTYFARAIRARGDTGEGGNGR